MPITEPISEQIVSRIVTQLKTIKIVDGYTQDVNVERVDEKGHPKAAVNKGAEITVVEHAPQYAPELKPGTRDAWRMKVAIITNLRHSEDARVSIGTIRARLLADVHKILGADPTCGGLADIMTQGKAEVGLDDRVPVADAMYDIVFFTARNNPYART